jgi:hypothetical protein
MLDTLNTLSVNAWQNALKPGHIVTFRFPVRDCDMPPKVRPCLVLDVIERGGLRFAVLAYGTTSRTNANRGFEIYVPGGLGAKLAGLRKPTRFVGARRATVSLDHPDFVCNREGTPILGHLVGTAFDRMNDVRAKIHAFADMREERREQRMKARRRAASHDRRQLSLF